MVIRSDNKSLDMILRVLQNETLEEAAKCAEQPGFVQARDSEWDDGFNYAKDFIARAIRNLKVPNP